MSGQKLTLFYPTAALRCMGRTRRRLGSALRWAMQKTVPGNLFWLTGLVGWTFKAARQRLRGRAARIISSLFISIGGFQQPKRKWWVRPFLSPGNTTQKRRISFRSIQRRMFGLHQCSLPAHGHQTTPIRYTATHSYGPKFFSQRQGRVLLQIE